VVGVAAALSLRHVSGRWKGFDSFAARAPYISGALIALVGLYTFYLGVSSLA
jgi:nickel/cobalt exporter